jgi:hypothetical protein
VGENIRRFEFLGRSVFELALQSSNSQPQASSNSPTLSQNISQQQTSSNLSKSYGQAAYHDGKVDADRERYGTEAGPASFPRPWDSSGAAEYEENLRTGPTLEAEDAELAQLKVEVARVKQKRERLLELQALEAREEELRERILAREKLPVSKP